MKPLDTISVLVSLLSLMGFLKPNREAYGELRTIPISFREEIYENEKVSLDLYPTGGAGVFDIFINYKE